MQGGKRRRRWADSTRERQLELDKRLVSFREPFNPRACSASCCHARKAEERGRENKIRGFPFSLLPSPGVRTRGLTGRDRRGRANLWGTYQVPAAVYVRSSPTLKHCEPHVACLTPYTSIQIHPLSAGSRERFSNFIKMTNWFLLYSNSCVSFCVSCQGSSCATYASRWAGMSRKKK